MTRACRWCGAKATKDVFCTGGNGCRSCSVRPCRHTWHLTPMYRDATYDPVLAPAARIQSPATDLIDVQESDEAIELGQRAAWLSHIWPDGWWPTQLQVDR